jgi:hypothetical protein
MRDGRKAELCTRCYGFGLWAVGDPVPMGPIDAMDGLPTIPCPECGANANPVEGLLKTIDPRSGEGRNEAKRE